MSFDAALTFAIVRLWSFDLETYKIEEGLLAPKIVCGSAGWLMSDGAIDSSLLPRDQAYETAKGILRDDKIMVGVNIAYDLGCLAAHNPDILPDIFRALLEGRVYDIQIAQALNAIACGNLYRDPRTGDRLRYPDAVTGKLKESRYSLMACVDLVLDRLDAKKNDTWRVRYGELDLIPMDAWPEEAKQYPLDDAINTLEVAIAQIVGGGRGCTPGPHRNLGDLTNQVETAFAMHLGAIWGLRTDPERIEALHRKTEEAHASFLAKFQKLGFYKPDGKEDGIAIKRAVVVAYNGGVKPDVCPAKCANGKILSPKSGSPINCKACSGTGFDIEHAPKTKITEKGGGGGVSADRDTLMESGDETLVALGENEPEKIRETYLPFLRKGLDRPLNLRPNVLVTSGRTSYDGVIQQMPREGDARSCFAARKGYVYCSVDYSAGELCTLAQVNLWLFGQSQMAEVINATGDPGSLHTALAAQMAGMSAEEMTALIKAKDEGAKKFRQAAKAGNFGFPGGMGPVKLVITNRKKNAGFTPCPEGPIVQKGVRGYPGIRFCVLVAGAERCGESKITVWNKEPTVPVCETCVKIVHEMLRPAWFKAYPEMRKYFDWVTSRVEAGGELPCFLTDRVRGGLEFSAGANNSFQALLADGAKYALRNVVRECYLDPSSPLWGTRPIFFVHDEVFAELPAETAHLAGPRLAEVMIDGLQTYCPDVIIKAEPTLMKFWNKNAETVYENGKLIPWEEKET